jgi:hypothetical protein
MGRRKVIRLCKVCGGDLVETPSGFFACMKGCIKLQHHSSCDAKSIRFEDATYLERLERKNRIRQEYANTGLPLAYLVHKFEKVRNLKGCVFEIDGREGLFVKYVLSGASPEVFEAFNSHTGDTIRLMPISKEQIARIVFG